MLSVSKDALDLGFRSNMEGNFGPNILGGGQSTSRKARTEFRLLVDPGSQRVLAAAKLYVRDDRLDIRYIQVAGNAKKQGYGRALFAMIFEESAAKGADFMHTEFQDYGHRYLLPLKNALLEKHCPV